MQSRPRTRPPGTSPEQANTASASAARRQSRRRRRRSSVAVSARSSGEARMALLAGSKRPQR